MFKVGDQVDWLGLKGTVVQTIDTVYGLVHVQFKTMGIGIHIFGSDGAYQAGQEPSLKLVSRPKKTVKQIRYPGLFTMINKDGRVWMDNELFINESAAKYHYLNDQNCMYAGLGPAIEIEVPQDEV